MLTSVITHIIIKFVNSKTSKIVNNLSAVEIKGLDQCLLTNLT